MELFQLVFNLIVVIGLLSFIGLVFLVLDLLFSPSKEEIEAYERQLEEIEQERLNKECDERLATQKRKEINLNDL